MAPVVTMTTQDVTAYKLKLLNSVLPLLSSDLAALPSSAGPGGRLRNATTGTTESDSSPPAIIVGLGLGARNEEVIAKRARHSSPPQSVAIRLSEAKSGSHAPTPELRSAAFSHFRSASNGINFSPQLGIKNVSNQNWKEAFPPERLHKLSASYREKALEMKRRGDQVARENKLPKAHLHATVILADAVLLYVFAFWCIDQASKKCHTSNWATIFGLLAFVKGSAEKAGASVVVGICLRIEAHVVHLLSLNEQKQLAFRGGQFVSSPANLPAPPLPTTGLSPSSQGSHGSPPNEPLRPPHPSHPSPTLTPSSLSSNTAFDLIKAYTKAGSEIFRHQKCWEEAAVILSPPVLASAAPKVWELCLSTSWAVDAAGLTLPVRPWTFAWPVDLGRTMSTPHSVVFCRAVLEEWAIEQGLEYEAVMVNET